ncbi:hypothetical protein VUR80DRAFT_9346 [Thermomyces stellatus]
MPRVPPPEVIAAWPAPNLANPERRGPAKTIVTVIFWAVAAAILVLRLYTRRYVSKHVGLDDLLVAAAFVPATAFSVVGIVVEYEFGWDRHIWDLSVEWITKGLQLSLTSFALFNLATTFTKLSILALTYRLTASTSTHLRRAVIALIVLNLLGMLTYLLLLFLQCRPFSAYWTLFPAPTPRRCLNEARTQLNSGCWNTVMDVVLVVLPMVIVLRSRSLPRRQMVVVVGLFAMGWLASLAGAVRTYLLFVQTTAPDHDFTWLSWVSYLASSVELYLGIICVSIPATKPFFMRALPRLLGSIPHSPKFAPEGPEKAEAANQDLISAPQRSGLPSSRRRDERRPPDLNKPLPALAKRIIEVESEQRSSAMIVDIGLRVSLHESVGSGMPRPVSEYSQENA